MKNTNYSQWDNIFELINPDNTMSFNRLIAHAIGAVETIIFFSLLSKMKYYMNRDMLDNDGFFYATEVDIQESTTFTKRVQAPAIAKLVEIGLIETKRAGLPAKRYFRIICDRELLIRLIERGEIIAKSIRDKTYKKSHKPHFEQRLQNVTSCCDTTANAEKCDPKQKLQNVTSCRNNLSQQIATISHNRSEQNVATGCNILSQHSYKSKENNLKDNNQSYQSIGFAEDKIDRIDEREKYRSLVENNIGYDWYVENAPKDFVIRLKLERVNELVEIILDVICSRKKSFRINQENMSHEVVKSTFLKLRNEHIEYVLNSLERTTSEVGNPRAYTISALYNSLQTANINEYMQTDFSDLY